MPLYGGIIYITALVACFTTYSKADLTCQKYNDEAVELWDAIQSTTKPIVTTTLTPFGLMLRAAYYQKPFYYCPLTCKCNFFINTRRYYFEMVDQNFRRQRSTRTLFICGNIV